MEASSSVSEVSKSFGQGMNSMQMKEDENVYSDDDIFIETEADISIRHDCVGTEAKGKLTDRTQFDSYRSSITPSI